MAVLRNGVLGDYTFLHNGVEMDRVLHNGIEELWVHATPWTVAFLSYPITETYYDGYSEKEVNTTNSGYTVSTKKAPDVIAFGVVSASVTLPTRKCNKVKIKYSANSFELDSGMANDVGTINGVTVYHGDKDKYLIFDCTGDNFTLALNVSDATEYHFATITVTEVAFYYESV